MFKLNFSQQNQNQIGFISWPAFASGSYASANRSRPACIVFHFSYRRHFLHLLMPTAVTSKRKNGFTAGNILSKQY